MDKDLNARHCDLPKARHVWSKMPEKCRGISIVLIEPMRVEIYPRQERLMDRDADVSPM